MDVKSQQIDSRTPARGYSLLELVLAVALVGGTLVPALALVREGLDASEQTDQRAMLANYAVGKLEEHLAIVASAWTTGVVEGDFAADGNDVVRFSVIRSDAVIDGGIVGELMHIQVTTYIDENGDDAYGASEPKCDFRTKIGRFASYEAIATL